MLPSRTMSRPLPKIFVSMGMEFISTSLTGSLNMANTEVISLFNTSSTLDYPINAWRYNDGADGIGLRAEHPNVSADLGNGSTRYLSYETYYLGLSTGTIGLLEK
ncbi:hypothetical protein F4677DRAFT_408507 [Hypoxylon crocopeplum]|nr:hypothetical protein F4677DRAFT_408507 [Hypoxylon crocopeplum]